MRKGKYLRRKQIIVNIPICLAVVLFWLVAITTYMSSGLYAKYSTSGRGSDSARVIQFGQLTVLEDADKTGEKMIFIPGVDLKKDIDVSFSGSEAACYVFIRVDTPGWTTTDHELFTEKSGLMSWELNVGTPETPVWRYLTSEENSHVKESSHRWAYPLPDPGNPSCP